jgi:hypothetical protein
MYLLGRELTDIQGEMGIAEFEEALREQVGSKSRLLICF